MCMCVCVSVCGGCGMRSPRGASACGCACAVLTAGAVLAACAASAAASTDQEIGPTCPPKAAEENRCRTSEPMPPYFNTYIDGALLTIYYNHKHLEIKCYENVTLDSDALPGFPTDQPVAPQSIKVESCSVPTGSYTAALAALNVTTANTKVLKLFNLPAHSLLESNHFRDLPTLSQLTVIVSKEAPLAKPRNDALFSNLTSLTRLDLSRLKLLPIDLIHLPSSLKYLKLTTVGIVNITEEILRRLTILNRLVVDESGPVVTRNVSVAPNLTKVTLRGGMAPQHSRLRHVAVYEWKEAAPAPWRECAALQNLFLQSMLNETRVALPDEWVAACHELQILTLQQVPLRELPPRLLANATKLQNLELTKCQLYTLPDSLFDDTVQLKLLDLSDNNLHKLPSEIFNRPSNTFMYLRELALSNNSLQRAALVALQPLTALQELHLEHNPLGDLCDDDSPLKNMRHLGVLWLIKTGASRVCPEWRHHMPGLVTLDLSNNNIVNLTMAKLGAKTINLRGNPIKSVLVSKHDNITEMKMVEVNMNSEIECNCDSAMLRRSGHMLRMFKPPLRCGGSLNGSELRSVDPTMLQCSVVGNACPRGCTCTRRADDSLTVACESADLRAPPLTTATLAAAPGAALHLLLANNHITTLSAADLPPQLLMLDLRNNSLTSIDSKSLETLFSVTMRRVNLSGNPFECACGASARALVSTLNRYRRQVDDIENVTCDKEHTLLDIKQPSALCWPSIVGAVAGALALVLLGVVCLAVGVRPARCPFLARALHKLGIVRDLDQDHEERRFDAFVSFSHYDERFVVEELVAQLEHAGYRLCLHYRDWAPGEWIPAQIAASVRASRRTIAVVSEHFLRSEWARAEFREAHAEALRTTRPRLLVVLLSDPSELFASQTHPGLTLGAELRSFLASNTYVRRDDPYFWSKLVCALPRPSRYPPNSTPAPLSNEPVSTLPPNEPVSGPPPDEPGASPTTRQAGVSPATQRAGASPCTRQAGTSPAAR